jgi:hypothetical protein
MAKLWATDPEIHRSRIQPQGFGEPSGFPIAKLLRVYQRIGFSKRRFSITISPDITFVSNS